MSITYTGVNGGSYVNTIVGPSPGDLITANSIGVVAQGAANLSKRLYDTKVERSGDTMTGALVVTATGGNVGVTATGNGVGSGVFGTGGATSGTGVEGVGGATNGMGVYGEGAGTGSGGEFAGGGSNGKGIVATGNGTGAGGTFTGGATGKGIVCDGGGTSGVAADIGTGGAQFTGTSPAATADPGANNMLFAANVPKAWGIITTDAMGGYTIEGGYNIASVTVNTAYIEVNFARPFADKNYSCTVSNAAAQPYFCSADFAASRTASKVLVYWKDDTGSGLNPSTTLLAVDLFAIGRQT